MNKRIKQNSTNMKVFWFCIILAGYIFCQEVVYYPSQSVLDTRYKNEVKREIKSIANTSEIANEIDGECYENITWRRFNEDQYSNNNLKIHKRALDPVFHGYPKTREELWNERFLNESTNFDQTPSLIELLHNVTLTYLTDCTPVILYDSQVKSKESYLVQNLLKGFPITFVHGFINESNELSEPKLLHAKSECLHFIIFLSDVKSSAKVIGKQPENKVILVARSSQWAVQEFLSSAMSRMFVNLLVIGQSFKEGDDKTLVRTTVSKYSMISVLTLMIFLYRKPHTFCILISCILMDWAQVNLL